MGNSIYTLCHLNLKFFRLHEIAYHSGSDVLAGDKSEYGHARVKIERLKNSAIHVNKLFEGLGSDIEVFMSHGKKLPGGPKF